MAKQESYCIDLLAGLSKFFYVEELEPFDVLTSFLDLLNREIASDYAFLISEEGNRIFQSSAADLALVGHLKDEAWIEKASNQVSSNGSLKSTKLRGYQLSDLPEQISGELKVRDIENWGKLYIKFPANYKQKAILAEMEQIVLFLSMFMYTVEVKARERLTAGLTSELRKTLRPDLALEKISSALQQFLGSAPLYFFKKLPSEDASNSVYECYMPRDADDGLAHIVSFEEIQRCEYMPAKYKAEIFESRVRDRVLGFDGDSQAYDMD